MKPEDVLREHPEWYHSIELAPGVVTPGRAPLAHWQTALHQLRLPDLRGKRVLDIGAYDGFFSFAAERAGAARVVALDHYAWSVDMVGYMRDWRSARADGATIPAPHDTAHWRPDALPGRRPFDAARACLGSKVEPVFGDFMTLDPEVLGRFDVVLFLGVLYHLEEPLTAVRRVERLTAPGGLCVIETEATEIPGSGSRALCEFFPGQELNADASNWWVPNRAALLGFCRAAGFRSADALPAVRPAGFARRTVRLLRRAAAATRLLNVPVRHRLVVHANR